MSRAVIMMLALMAVMMVVTIYSAPVEDSERIIGPLSPTNNVPCTWNISTILSPSPNCTVSPFRYCKIHPLRVGAYCSTFL